MKLQSPLAIGATSLVATAAIGRWMSTLDYAVDYRDPTVDPVHPHYRGAKIFVFWHENILMPLVLRGHSNTAMLLSRHTDANILDRVARMMGFGVVRGSTFHGGSAALRELAKRASRSNLTITPDGPRGPRRRLAAGCVFLASTLQIPIVAMGFGCQKPWRLRTSWVTLFVEPARYKQNNTLSDVISLSLCSLLFCHCALLKNPSAPPASQPRGRATFLGTPHFTNV